MKSVPQTRSTSANTAASAPGSRAKSTTTADRGVADAASALSTAVADANDRCLHALEALKRSQLEVKKLHPHPAWWATFSQLI